jgi:hypothetical protein
MLLARLLLQFLQLSKKGPLEKPLEGMMKMRWIIALGNYVGMGLYLIVVQ